MRSAAHARSPPPAAGDGKVLTHHRNRYFKTRRNLRVVFHLVDGRHGCVSEDARIMRQCADAFRGSKVEYVVVLTKADKNGSKGVDSEVAKGVREVMKECGVGGRPLLITSSTTKLGRDEMWRFLKTCCEY
jgi:GTP-binding protein EngB required for normal cell division